MFIHCIAQVYNHGNHRDPGLHVIKEQSLHCINVPCYILDAKYGTPYGPMIIHSHDETRTEDYYYHYSLSLLATEINRITLAK